MADDLKEFRIRLGKRIKSLRDGKKLTQPELGALVNKDYQAIGRIENGRINPSAYVIYQLAKALNVEVQEIYDFSKIQ